MALPPHLADLEGRLASRVDEALAGYRRAYETRLREATERLLADTSSVAPPTVASLLAEVESETLEAAPRREGARSAVAALVDAARGFDRAATQAEVLAALVAAGRGGADRVALFVVRGDTLVEFESAGFDGPRARGRELPFNGELGERVAGARGCLAFDAEAAARAAATFGWTPAGPAVVVPLVLRDRIAALVWADRAAGAPELGPLQLLTLVAAQRLELQALSERAFTPTLYEDGAAPASAATPLQLWSAVAAAELAPPPPAPVEPAPEESASAAAFEIVGDEPAASLAAFETPEADAAAAEGEQPAPVESAPAEAVADELWTGATTAAFESLPAPEPSPLQTFEIEARAVESAAELAFEPVTELDAPPVAPATAEPERPAESAPDLLSTMRLPILPFPSAGGERATEEGVAPERAEEPPARAEGATTLEFPTLAAPPASEPIAPPAAANAPDLTEDATLLTQRFPIFPAPAPSAPPVAFAPLAPEPSAPAPPPAPPAEDPLDRTASRMRSTEVAPPPDLQGPGRAFLGRQPRVAVEPPTHEEAKRLARLLISEIKLYNEEQVLEGRRNRDLYHRLKEDIDRSRQIYEERVHESVRGATDYFHQELVRSLAGGDTRALGL